MEETGLPRSRLLRYDRQGGAVIVISALYEGSERAAHLKASLGDRYLMVAGNSPPDLEGLGGGPPRNRNPQA